MTLRLGDLEDIDSYIDARAGAIRLAQFVNLVCGFLKKE